MKVIGAGLPRTATLTQKVALEMLGFAPCYHMVNVLGNLDTAPRWRQALEGGSDWDDIFDGFAATVDWPGAFFYRELMDAYPEAKVLLSVRDGDAWERSMSETIWGIFYGDLLIHDLSNAWGRVDQKWASYILLMKTMWDKSGLLGSEAADPGAGEMARAMERYNEEVIRTVPSDRLLVWSPKDGWDPLCEFLETPVPEVALPHVNDAKQFGDRIVDAAVNALNQWREQEMTVGAGK
ncbi:MAG TPA: sulfotransferase [Acidimicrobiales bacterium]|nr:sulfotransferase [Acidimicrobiales bacterium]